MLNRGSDVSVLALRGRRGNSNYPRRSGNRCRGRIRIETVEEVVQVVDILRRVGFKNRKEKGQGAQRT